MNQIRTILSQFKELYLRMDGSQRLSMALFSGAVFIAILVFLMQATKSPSDQVLFFSVSSKQASEITTKLSEIGIESDYSNGAILVSSDENIDQIKMSLAKEDLLPDDLDYDFRKVVGQSNPMLTKDERSTNYHVALQNEVSRVLTSMDAITDASVIISQEEPSPLLIRHEHRTAMVKVAVKGKRELANNEVKAIVRLVASSVKNLDPKNVTVTDSIGRPYEFDLEGGATDKFALKESLEKKLSRKIENHLLQFVPKAKATVAIDLNLRKHKKEIKDYQHKLLNQGASSALTNTLSEKEESNTKEGSKGVVGAATNVGGDIKEGDGLASVDQKKSKKQEQLDNSVVQEFITEDKGQMNVLSVAVVIANKKLNEAFDPSKEQDENNREYIEAEWDKEKEVLIKQISSIAAVDPSNVSLTIQEMMLARTPAPPSFMDKFLGGLNGMKVFLGMIFFASVGSIFLVRMVKKAQPEEEIIPMPEFEEEEKEDNLPPLVEPEVDPKMRQIENRVKEIIEDDPQRAASLIRSWLSNE